MRNGGYGNLNFRKIAEQLNISKANIHHHFGNKKGLANEVIREYSSKMLIQFKRLAVECDYGLSKFMTGTEEIFWSSCLKADHCFFCVCDPVARISNAPDKTKIITQEFYKNLFEIINGVVKNSLKKGQLRSALLGKQVTHQLLMLIFGLASIVQMKATVVEAEKILRGTIQSWVKTLIA